MLEGTPAQLPRGVSLLVGGAHPADIGDSSPRLLGLRLRPGERVMRILPVAHGLVVQVSHAQLSFNQPGSDVYWVRHGRSSLIRSTDELVAGAAPDRVFALTYGPSDGTGTGERAAGKLQELAVTGAVLAQHEVPAGFTIEADTPTGLLVAMYPNAASGLGQLQLVDRRTLRIVRQLGPVGQVVAADGRHVAWQIASCEQTCEITVEDLASRRRDTVTAAHGYYVGAGAISPNGRQIALGYYGRRPGQTGGAAPGFVEVINVGTGVRRRAPGVATGVKQVADLAWTLNGRELAISVGLPENDARRIALWPATGGTLRVLPGHYSDSGAPSALTAS